MAVALRSPTAHRQAAHRAAERCYRWNLLYSMSKHGASLRSLYSRVRAHHKADPCALETQFIIIQTTKGSVFGGYAAGTKLLPPSNGGR